MAEDIVKKDAKLKRITWKTRQTRAIVTFSSVFSAWIVDLPFLCVQSVTWILTTAIPGMIGSFRIGNFFSRYYLLKRLTLRENCFH